MTKEIYLLIQEIMHTLGLCQTKILQDDSLGGDLTLNEVKILEIIGTSRKRKMMKDIAQLMGMTKGGMTFLVDKLEKKGLVKRTPSEFDRRVIYIEITEKGKELHEKLSGFKYEFIHELIHDMSDSAKEMIRMELDKAADKANKLIG